MSAGTADKETQAAATSAAQSAAPDAREKNAPANPLAICEETTGEKYYHRIKFIAAEGFILAATAALAYVARYGKDAYHGIPNVLKKFQHGFEEKLMHNRIYPLGEKGPVAKRLAQASASAMVTMHGGNLFAPFMKAFENNKKRIVNYFNRRYGEPGELEIGQERLQNEPRQSWGDVIKGRLAAFGIVASSFFTVDALLGKNKKTGQYRFDEFEDWFGRKIAGISKDGKALAESPVAKELPEALAKNKTYRFGKILALDIYATTAAILIWNAVSRLSAKKRSVPQATQPAMDVAHSEQESPPPAHAEKITPEAQKTISRAGKPTSYAEMVTSQQSAGRQSPSIAG